MGLMGPMSPMVSHRRPHGPHGSHGPRGAHPVVHDSAAGGAYGDCLLFPNQCLMGPMGPIPWSMILLQAYREPIGAYGDCLLFPNHCPMGPMFKKVRKLHLFGAGGSAGAERVVLRT